MLLPKGTQISPSSTPMTRVPHKYKGQSRNKRIRDLGDGKEVIKRQCGISRSCHIDTISFYDILMGSVDG